MFSSFVYKCVFKFGDTIRSMPKYLYVFNAAKFLHLSVQYIGKLLCIFDITKVVDIKTAVTTLIILLLCYSL